MTTRLILIACCLLTIAPSWASKGERARADHPSARAGMGSPRELEPVTLDAADLSLREELPADAVASDSGASVVEPPPLGDGSGETIVDAVERGGESARASRFSRAAIGLRLRELLSWSGSKGAPAALTAAIAVGGAVAEAQPAAPRHLFPASPLVRIAETSQYMRVRDLSDLVAKWNKDTKVYAIGDVSRDLSPSTLQNIEDEVRTLSPHATVLFVESNRGHAYGGYSNLDAVKYVTGQVINRLPAFQAQLDPRTGQPNGIILVFALSDYEHPRQDGTPSIFLRYVPSATQRDLGYGEESWNGNLNRWAIEALRNNRRDFRKAVRDSLTNINKLVDDKLQPLHNRAKGSVADAKAKLAKLRQELDAFRKTHGQIRGMALPDATELQVWEGKIGSAEGLLRQGHIRDAGELAAEVASKAGQSLAAIEGFERSRARAAAEIARTKAALDELGRAVEAFKGAYQNANGGLIRPAFSSSIEDAEKALKDGDVAGATVIADKILEEAAAHAAALGGYKNALALTAVLDRRMAELPKKKYSAAQKSLDAAALALRDAKDFLARGEAGYPAKVDAAERAVKAVERAFRDARAKEVARYWFVGGLLSLLTGIGVLLLFLSFMYALKVRSEALAKLKTRTDALDKKRKEKVETFNKRFAKQAPPEGGYEGESKGVYERLQEGMRNLPILEKSERTATELAARLARGRSPRWGRYARALDTLKEIRFSDVEYSGLKEVVEKLRLAAGSKEKLAETVSIEELDTHYDKVYDQFVSDLDAMDAANLKVGELLESVPVTIQKVAALKAGIDEAAGKDALIPSLFSATLPALDREFKALIKPLSKDPIDATKTGAAELVAKIGAAGGLAELASTYHKAAARVQAERKRLGAALGLEPSRVLAEEGVDLDKGLKAARTQIEAANEALGNGDAAQAVKLGQDAESVLQRAGTIIDRTIEVFQGYSETAKKTGEETVRIEGLFPDSKRQLGEIRERFADTVMTLGAGDESHPRENDTIADNMEEATDHIGTAKAKAAESEKAFRAGRFLASADLLVQAKGHQEFVLHRLGEIAKKTERLAKVVAENKSALQALAARVVEYKGTIAGDPKTMQATVDAYEAAEKEIAALTRELGKAGKADPFEHEAALAAAKAALDHVSNDMARNDRDIWNHATSTFNQAKKQLGAADKLLERARFALSMTVGDAQDEVAKLNALGKRLETAEKGLATAHGDWHALDGAADKIAAETARLVNGIQKEVRHLESINESITKASESVRRAGSWTGSYGIQIQGAPGSEQLENARRLLRKGNYDQAAKLAEQAAQAALSALSEAEREVEREAAAERRREEARELARRREREAREAREEARQSRTQSSDWSIGSSSSSSSSSGSGWGTSFGGGDTSFGGGSSGGTSFGGGDSNV